MTVETGLSDFHKMTLTVIKVLYKKQKTNIVMYRNNKQFSNEAFMFAVKNSIIQMTSERNDLEFDRFKTALEKAIQRHAPIKKRYVRVNPAPFINKKINKEIMKRSQGRSQNLKAVPQNFMEVLKVDGVTANDVIQKKQHLLTKEKLQISHSNHYCLISIFSIKLLKRLEIWFSFLRE